MVEKIVAGIGIGREKTGSLLVCDSFTRSCWCRFHIILFRQFLDGDLKIWGVLWLRNALRKVV